MTKTLQWSSEVEIREGSLLTGKGYKSIVNYFIHTHTHTHIIYLGGCGDSYIDA